MSSGPMLASSLTDTQGILAIAAAAVAVVALLGCAGLAASVRRMRRAQSLVVGAAGERDLIEHAAGLEEAFEALRAYSAQVAQALEARLADVEQSLIEAISNWALVHYDAYNELSGRQSMSIALLDGTRSGIVITCIHHRDQARVYAKRVRQGVGDVELSPEEAEAVQRASETSAIGDDGVRRAS
ncbi:MAG TPA: DUF4446 family protein [Solirubrobacteraceae bacterium]|nr:DUF4446 family protein [Solirubrobacteraceae bacterium]